MPTSIESLVKEMETSNVGQLSSIQKINYNIRRGGLGNAVVGKVPVVDPGSSNVNRFKNIGFNKRSGLSGKHTILLDFGQEVEPTIYDLDYYGGTTRFVERFDENFEDAKDTNGRQLPSSELPTIQRRRNQRIGRERIVIL